MYKILVVPGASDGIGGNLELGAELSRLSTLGARFDDIAVELLPEGMTELEIVDRLSGSTQNYDALHLLGHADEAGFHMTDGAVLTVQSLKSICRDCGARTVFINSCESAKLGQYLVNNGVAVSICYSTGVMDSAAIIIAVRFYSALAKSSDPFRDGLREGYNAADPGDGSLMWLTNGEYVQEIISPIIARLDSMDVSHTSTFSSFQKSIQKVESEFAKRIGRLSRQSAMMRGSIIAVIATMVLSMFIVIWATSAFAQTIPDPPVGGTIPDIPTRKPTKVHGSTIPPRPTQRPKPTGSPMPTDIPESTVSRPTSAPRETVELPSDERATATAKPTAKPTKKPTKRPSGTPTDAPIIPTATATGTPTIGVPTPFISSTSTLTNFERAVIEAVRATMEAHPTCSCQQ